MRFILLQEAENPKGCLGKFCGFLPKLEVLGRNVLQSKIQSALAICPFVAHVTTCFMQARSDCHLLFPDFSTGAHSLRAWISWGYASNVTKV